MALKDFERHRNEITTNYVDSSGALKELVEAYKNGKVTKESVEYLQNSVAELKGYLEELNYIAYLLHLPKHKKLAAFLEKFKARKAIKKIVKSARLRRSNEIAENIKKEADKVNGNTDIR